MNQALHELLLDLGLAGIYASPLNKIILILAAFFIAFIVDLASKKILLSVITKIVRRTST